MAVNYTLFDIETALMNHSYGLTEDELFEYEQYYTDFWTDNVYSQEIQPLEEFVEDFLLWLAEGNNTFFENRDKFLKNS